MSDRPKYEAVDVAELRRRLGHQCSPDRSRHGYVIGPDITGRLCHCASCFSIVEARDVAARYNELYSK